MFKKVYSFIKRWLRQVLKIMVGALDTLARNEFPLSTPSLPLAKASKFFSLDMLQGL